MDAIKYRQSDMKARRMEVRFEKLKRNKRKNKK